MKEGAVGFVIGMVALLPLPLFVMYHNHIDKVERFLERSLSEGFLQTISNIYTEQAQQYGVMTVTVGTTLALLFLVRLLSLLHSLFFESEPVEEEKSIARQPEAAASEEQDEEKIDTPVPAHTTARRMPRR